MAMMHFLRCCGTPKTVICKFVHHVGTRSGARGFTWAPTVLCRGREWFWLRDRNKIPNFGFYNLNKLVLRMRGRQRLVFGG